MLVVPQPVWDVTVESGSETFQLRLTLLTYQPLVPRVPVIVGVTTGGVESATKLAVYSCEPLSPATQIARLPRSVKLPVAEVLDQAVNARFWSEVAGATSLND